MRFHKIAALVVFAASAAWIATGEFSSVGSRADEAQAAVEAKPQAVEAPKRTVMVVTPPRVDHARAIRIAGTTAADKRAELATRAGGIVGELPFSQGDRVKSGDLILSLAAEDREVAVESARQLLAQREAEATASERLVKTGTVGKLQLDNVRSALAAARLQLETAQAELARNEVRAPFDGIVDRITVEKGSAVMQGASVATVLALDPIIGLGEVSERDLGYLKLGDRAEVRLVSGAIVEGTLRYVSRDASETTRTFRVEIAIPNPERTIPAGMTAEITLRAAPTASVVLPRSVVTLSHEGDLGIRAVDTASKVTFFPIDIVDDTPKGLILAGIPDDARVIVAGQELVKEGDVVNPTQADEAMIKRLVGEVTGTD